MIVNTMGMDMKVYDCVVGCLESSRSAYSLCYGYVLMRKSRKKIISLIKLSEKASEVVEKYEEFAYAHAHDAYRTGGVMCKYTYTGKDPSELEIDYIVNDIVDRIRVDFNGRLAKDCFYGDWNLYCRTIQRENMMYDIPRFLQYDKYDEHEKEFLKEQRLFDYEYEQMTRRFSKEYNIDYDRLKKSLDKVLVAGITVEYE